MGCLAGLGSPCKGGCFRIRLGVGMWGGILWHHHSDPCYIDFT